MIDRKAALVGCRHGQWVRTHGMKGLRLNAKAKDGAGVILRVAQISDGGVTEAFFRPGIHELPSSPWTRLEVAEGPHASVLCLLETS